MKWNWQLEDWPNFTWDSDKLVVYEQSFTESGGIIIGSSQHISQEGKQNLFIDLTSIPRGLPRFLNRKV